MEKALIFELIKAIALLTTFCFVSSIPTIFLNRGGANGFPENTIASFTEALRVHATIELDVRESKDGHYVIIHDATLERTTNGSGNVSDYTLHELKQLDAGSWYNSIHNNLRIPTLVEVFELQGKYNMISLMIEIKAVKDYDHFIKFVHHHMRKHTKFLLYFNKKFDPQFPIIRTVAAKHNVRFILKPECLKNTDFESCVSNEVVNNPHFAAEIWNINYALITDDVINIMKKYSKESFVNLVGMDVNMINETLWKDIVTGVDFICVDDPAYVQKNLKSQF